MVRYMDDDNGDTRMDCIADTLAFWALIAVVVLSLAVAVAVGRC